MQATHLNDAGEYSAGIQQFHRMLAKVAPHYRDDEPLAEVIERVRDFLRSAEVDQYLEKNVRLDEETLPVPALELAGLATLD
jgi:hypothetical protein